MKFLAKDQLLAFLSEARGCRERDWLMYLVAYWHGLRAKEVVGGWLVTKDKERVWYRGLTPTSIASGFLTVPRLKGSDTTVQPLVSDANPLLDERHALETLAGNTPSVNRLFPFSRVHYFRLFRKYAKRADIPAHLWHPHSLRHSIAMHTIHSAGIENVRKYLGHKSIASTGEYLKVTDEDASAAIARAMRPVSDATS